MYIDLVKQWYNCPAQRPLPGCDALVRDVDEDDLSSGDELPVKDAGMEVGFQAHLQVDLVQAVVVVMHLKVVPKTYRWAGRKPCLRGMLCTVLPRKRPLDWLNKERLTRSCRVSGVSRSVGRPSMAWTASR